MSQLYQNSIYSWSFWFPSLWGFQGVTLQGQLRRKPNAFNLLHQLEFLERTGLNQDMSIKTLEVGYGLELETAHEDPEKP